MDEPTNGRGSVVADTWDMRPLEPGPGDQYFSDINPETKLETPQRQALREIRELLDRLQPAYAEPENTAAELSDYHELSLTITHAERSDCQLEVHVGDGYCVVAWPGFAGGFGNDWDWEPKITLAFEALISGQNQQVLTSSMGRLTRVKTAVWVSEQDWNRTFTWRRWRTVPLSLLPVRRTQRIRSISFDRREPFAGA